MQRRKILWLTATAVATAVGTGCTTARLAPEQSQVGSDPIEFEDSSELVLDPPLLPGGGWEQVHFGDGEIFDVTTTYRREVRDNTDSPDAAGGFWSVRSGAAGRETASEATELYENVYAAFSGRVGGARLMDLDLCSDAAFAGYDGLARAIFRDVNCVGSVTFADCTRSTGCLSHVDQCERLARSMQESWRGAPTDSEDGGDDGGDAGEQTEIDDEPADGHTPSPRFVDEVNGQVRLAYGDTARVSNGVQVTVYQGTIHDQLGDEVPADRERFLVVPVEAENTSDQPRTLPDQTQSWDILFGDQQVSNVFDYGALDAAGYGALEGGEVQEGVLLEGVLLFEVDEGYEASEMEILWQDRFLIAGDLEGNIDVHRGAGV